MQGAREIAGVASVGDGATSTGAWHEALNQAAVERLPLVMVVANNQYAYSTPTSWQYACQRVVDRAPGYGIAGHTVDGTNLVECLKVVGQAIAQARRGEGPQLVEASLLRLCGHGEHDDASYVDTRLRELPVGQDCMRCTEASLMQQGWVTRETLDAWRAEAVGVVESVVARVQREPLPNPFEENWQALATPRLLEVHEEDGQ
jgi:pyruvate dehydrogenase E1 component alpha subunit/2-oxoisovalerate dehydrogenase E1 component alpha subunit